MKVNNLCYNTNYLRRLGDSFPFRKEMDDRYTYELAKLGEQIRKYRLVRNMTQVDLALKCSVDNGDISRIENGRKNLEFYTIVKLAEALSVELNELFPSEVNP